MGLWQRVNRTQISARSNDHLGSWREKQNPISKTSGGGKTDYWARLFVLLLGICIDDLGVLVVREWCGEKKTTFGLGLGLLASAWSKR